jgi:ribonuclease D
MASRAGRTGGRVTTAEIAAIATREGRIAIDTEFVSERRYRALLCLVQVAVPDPEADGGVRTEVLDPLGELDPGPLAAVLADPEVEVVLHAGRQDVAIIRRTWDTGFTRVFDTQVAAGFLGLGSQEGYESLVRRVLKVRLDGRESFTKWDRRPLEPEQLEYARDDARLLLQLGAELQDRLRQAGRLEWAIEECRSLEASTDQRTPEEAFTRVPKLARLGDEQRAVALELIRWRESIAEELDRPVSFVIPDQALIELARRAPGKPSALEHIRGLPPQTAHRRGRELIDAIDRGRRAEPPAKAAEPPRRDPYDGPVASLAQALVRQRALENNLATELIANQSELAAVVGAARRGESAAGIRVVEGWRRDLVGDELLELIAGRRTVRVNDGGRLEAEGP